MKKTHMNMFFPQWQGGGQDLSTYRGGMEIKDNYLDNAELAEVAVSTADISAVKNNIAGYDEILEQLTLAKSLIRERNPATVFTLGGGCDAGAVSVSYLNNLLAGDMTLIYFDAHGDMNTPESSVSKCFYGMSLRALLGIGDKQILDLLSPALSPEQVIIVGGRDFDKPEADYIREQNITLLTVEDAETDAGRIISAVKAKGRDNICIHVDPDVLDPREFPHIPVPVPEGLKRGTLLGALRGLSKEFRVAGLGLFEYSPAGIGEIGLIREIAEMGLAL